MKTTPSVMLLFIALLSPCAARADLRFCNNTGQTVFIAVGYHSNVPRPFVGPDQLWTSEGWFNAPPGSCGSTLVGRLTNEYYYFYAVNATKTAVWDGSQNANGRSFAITPNQAFTYYSQPLYCDPVRGCQSKSFQRIDIGSHTRDSYTVTLVEDQLGPLRAAKQCSDSLGDVNTFSSCWLKKIASSKQRIILGCLQKYPTSDMFFICAGTGNGLTPEQQIWVRCGMQSGPNAYAIAGCVGGALTQRELEKCVKYGIGGRHGCFGRDNTAVKVITNAFHDVTRGPDQNNDLVGRKGWTCVHLLGCSHW